MIFIKSFLLKLRHSRKLQVLLLTSLSISYWALKDNEEIVQQNVFSKGEKTKVLDIDQGDIDLFASKRLRQNEIKVKKMEDTIDNLNKKIDGLVQALQESKDQKSKKDQVDHVNTKSSAVKKKNETYASKKNSQPKRNTTHPNNIERYSRPRVSYATPKALTFKVKLKDRKIQILSGSRVNAVILNGIKGTTGAPEPVVMVLTGKMKMPNNKQIDLSGCFALGKAQIKLSAGRSDTLIDTLSCIKGNNTPIHIEKISAFTVDKNDGYNGVSGELSAPDNNSILYASLSKMFEQAAQIASNHQNQVSNSTSPLGSVQTVISNATNRRIIGGAIQGGASVVANWWQKNSSLQMPHLKVKDGKRVTLTFISKFELPKEPFIREEVLNEKRKRFLD